VKKLQKNVDTLIAFIIYNVRCIHRGLTTWGRMPSPVGLSVEIVKQGIESGDDFMCTQNGNLDYANMKRFVPPYMEGRYMGLPSLLNRKGSERLKREGIRRHIKAPRR
jgi:hypothetical protein